MLYSTVCNLMSLNATVKCRVRKAKRESTKVVDTDGSHLDKKQQKLLSEGVLIGRSTALPKPPLAGWESVTANHKEMASKLPRVFHSRIDSRIV